MYVIQSSLHRILIVLILPSYILENKNNKVPVKINLSRLLYGCKGAYHVGTEAKRNANVSLATCHAQIDANTFLVAYSREVVKKQVLTDELEIDLELTKN